MATILQAPPLSDVIAQNVSDAYFNQLQAIAAIAPVVWTTTISTSAFSVAANGNLFSGALLTPGTYTASGTMQDASANTGQWTFTLTIKSTTPSPATSVIPVVPSQPLTPFGLEVMVPFQINPATGQVMTTNQYQDIIAQHVLSILMTAKGERVMIPGYGVGMQNFVFKPDTPLIEAEIQSTITNSFKTWEPAVQIQKVVLASSIQQPNLLTVTVTYSTTPYQTTNTVTVSLGGSIPSAPITTIGQFSP
jgi:hypothetical protein